MSSHYFFKKRTTALLKVVWVDLQQGPADEARRTWERYASDMWSDRKDMYDGVADGVTFIEFRAVVREAARMLL